MNHYILCDRFEEVHGLEHYEPLILLLCDALSQNDSGLMSEVNDCWVNMLDCNPC